MNDRTHLPAAITPWLGDSVGWWEGDTLVVETTNLDVKGHLTADNIEVKLGTVTDTLLDTVVADGEYSPNSGVAVASSTLKRGTAVLNLTGTVHPRRFSRR